MIEEKRPLTVLKMSAAQQHKDLMKSRDSVLLQLEKANRATYALSEAGMHLFNYIATLRAAKVEARSQTRGDDTQWNTIYHAQTLLLDDIIEEWSNPTHAVDVAQHRLREIQEKLDNLKENPDNVRQ